MEVDEGEYNLAVTACYEKIVSYTPKDGVCNVTWDRIMCWDAAQAGTLVQQQCPHYVKDFTHSGYATRECDDTGHWIDNLDFNTTGGWTNLSDCLKPDPEYASIMEDLSRIRFMSNIGYGISLAALAVAVLLMLCTRHCKSNNLHINLFMAFIARAVIALIKDSLFVHGIGLESDVTVSPDGSVMFNVEGSHWQCKLLVTSFIYTVSASLMWIFMEGLYLHMLVYKTLFTERNGIRMYVLIGWFSPLLYIIPWVLVRITVENKQCWNTNDRKLIWIIKTPIIVTILINFAFFINIVRVLCQRVKAQHRNTKGAAEMRKLAKFAVVLIPLFGVLYIGFSAYPPGLNVKADVVYLYAEMFYNSFQGLLLAVLFCFLNEEVHNGIRRCWYRTRGRENSFTRSFTLTSYRKASTRASHTSHGPYGPGREKRQNAAKSDGNEQPLLPAARKQRGF